MKSFEDLGMLDEVVVKVGPKVEVRGGKVVIVDAERNVVMTKEGFDLIEKDEEGNGILTPVQAIGTPIWSVENKIRTYEIELFGGGSAKKAKKTKADKVEESETEV